MTRREFEMLQAGRSMTPPGITEFGGTLVATTPEETLWSHALAKAQARIDNPRWLAGGVSYDGKTGNIDTPEIVASELFSPLQNAFYPEAMIEKAPKALTDLDRSMIQDREARRIAELDRLNLTRDREKRLAEENRKRIELAERKALNDFNTKSSLMVTPKTKAQEYALKVRMDLAKDKITRAQRMGDADAENAAIEELDGLEKQLGGLFGSAPTPTFANDTMPSFEISPSTVTRSATSLAAEPPTLPAPSLPTPTIPTPRVSPPSVSTNIDIEMLRKQAMEAMKRKDPASVARRFKELTGEDLQPTSAPVTPTIPQPPQAESPLPPFYGPLPPTNAPVARGMSLGDFAETIKQDYASNRISEAEATDALAKLEQSVKQAFASGKMTDASAARALMELGFSKAEAYEFLMSEEQ